MSEDYLFKTLPTETGKSLKLDTCISDPDEFIESFRKRREAKDEHNRNDDVQSNYYCLGNSKKRTKKLAANQPRLLGNGRRPLSVKEKKLMKINDFRNEKNLTYDAFLPLQQLWLKYFQKTVMFRLPGCNVSKEASTNWSENKFTLVRERLLKSDFHGCIMSVTKSKCPFLVGTTGIIIQETRNVFKMITKEDAVKVVPKMNSVFTFEVNDYTFNIYGNQFRVKPSERCVRKFKSKSTIDL